MGRRMAAAVISLLAFLLLTACGDAGDGALFLMRKNFYKKYVPKQRPRAL